MNEEKLWFWIWVAIWTYVIVMWWVFVGQYPTM